MTIIVGVLTQNGCCLTATFIQKRLIDRESVAKSTNGLNQFVFSEVREHLSEPSNMNVHRTLLNERILGPDLIQQLGSTVDPVRVCHKELKQAILCRTHVNGIVIDADAMLVRR